MGSASPVLSFLLEAGLLVGLSVLLALPVHQHVHHRRLALLAQQGWPAARRRRALRTRLRHQDTDVPAVGYGGGELMVMGSRWLGCWTTAEAAATTTEGFLDVALEHVEGERGARGTQRVALLVQRGRGHVLVRLHGVLTAQRRPGRSVGQNKIERLGYLAVVGGVVW